MRQEPRSPCHRERELASVPGEKYKRCPVCEHLWKQGPDGQWTAGVNHYSH